MRRLTDIELISLLSRTRTIAVVGLSAEAYRPSYGVAQYLQKYGYRIIPVNPGQKAILGQKCFPDLASIPEPVDMVNVFRRSEHVAGIVEAALAIKAPALWLQLNISDEAAEQKALQAGMEVVQGVCIKEVHWALRKKLPSPGAPADPAFVAGSLG